MGYVDLERIRPEPVAVDQAHVVELEGLFYEQSGGQPGKTGQLQPILLFEIPGQPQFFIADGFHRDQILRRMGAASALSVIKPNCTIAELYDWRIKATDQHDSVKFARAAGWIEKAWEETPWASKLSAIQAFTMHSQPAQKRESMASRLGLDSATLDAALRWTAEKTLEWKIPALRIQADLVDMKRVDPELMHEARAGRGMGARGFLTPQQVKVIGRELPGEYILQKMVAVTVKAQRLSIPDTEELARSITRTRSLEEANQLINSRSWRQTQPNYPGRSATRRPITSYPTEQPAQPQVQAALAEQTDRLLEVIVENELAIAGLYLALASEKGQLTVAGPGTVDQHPGSVVIPGVTEEQKGYLKAWLPHLSEIQRRSLLLGTIYKLPKAVVAEVLNTDAETVERAVVSAGLAIQKVTTIKKP